MQLSRDHLIAAYRRMRTIRDFEERLSSEIAKGSIPGFTHLYAGQEACAVGVCDNLGIDDYIVSTHRGHGHCIAKGVAVKPMMAEIYGKGTGTCGGKSGSMHIADLDVGMLGANGIVGGGPPIAVGAAIAARNKGEGKVTLAFGGDGSCNQGTVFEAMNLAVVLKLPVLFIFENNNYSEHTHVSYAIGADDLTERSRAFGMHAEKVKGDDYFEVYEAVGAAVERARQGEGPQMLELSICRFFGHVEGDPQNYRGEGELADLRENMDCLKVFREKVTSAALLTDEDLDTIDAEVAQLINEACDEAAAAPWPDPAELYTNVYNEY